ncbi:MAG: methylated-DNA--[protein]-cysteine S-methyltransferase [Sphingobacteriales bacterium]|nr:MAG: methylated-DNA--[protein]-cysteine S-methyltransferase [Sphingobacteriales bacterium]
MEGFAFYDSPIGRIKIGATHSGIHYMEFTDDNNPIDSQEGQLDCLISAKEQLHQYFNRNLMKFDLPLNLEGTAFQKSVWRYLLNTSFGETDTYGTIAKKLVNISAARAVGAACGANPIAIVVPCHRIVSSSGDLTGYAGGLWRKKWLLEFEQSDKPGRQTSLF